MNLDIGGGITDVAVIEYQDAVPGPGVQLSAQLLFKDSSTVAGDSLVREIIETVLLPALARGIQDDASRERFRLFLASIKGHNAARWRRVTRQVLIPIVRRWLSDLTADRYNDPVTGTAPTPLDMVPGPAIDLINEMNQVCEEAIGISTIIELDQPLHYQFDGLKRCIRSVFSDHLSSLGKVCEAFDCDLLLVSGKPSELPGLKDLVELHIPLPSGRIIFAHNYEISPWYPLSDNGRIRDAKTVTVAGAALYQAVKQQLLPQWRIMPSVVNSGTQRNFWGIMPPPKQ